MTKLNVAVMSKHKKHIGFLLLVFLAVFLALVNVKDANAAQAAKLVVNVPVANMYAEANARTPVVSQALYNEEVSVINSQHGFYLIQTQDDYQGWVPEKFLSRARNAASNNVQVKSLFANVFQEADIGKHVPLLTLPFGTRLPLIKVANEDWVAVALVDGKTGWIQRGDVITNPHPMTMASMLALSHQFIGLPYLWGGVSSFGFDCSGFAQNLYKQIGILLPRDTKDQVYAPSFVNVSLQNLHQGDLLYFGWDNKVSHTGVYLGDNKFINATTYGEPCVQIGDLRAPHWRAMFIVARHFSDSDNQPAFIGSAMPIPAAIKEKMQRYTWRQGCPVPLENLAYLKLSYWGFDDKPHQGEMVVNKSVASEVMEIFQELYEQKFPIEKMRLMDAYQGNDDAADEDNNTSAFNCRAMTDFPDQYSVHSYGKAIDINPTLNPYVNNGKITPASSAKYVDRAVYHKGKIIKDSSTYKSFIDRGWMWGGDWVGNLKDYQHFEKPSK